MGHKSLLIFVCIFFLLKTSFANNNISYIHKDISYLEISKIEKGWIPFNTSISKGLENGVYWFKLDLEPSEKERVIRIPESHITRTTLFFNDYIIPIWTPNNYITYKIPASEIQNTIYLKVSCLLEARIPIEVLSIYQYYENKVTAYVIMALYYAIVLIILLFNLFSYINLKNKAYLYYMFMVLGMSINAFYKDGLFAYLFGFKGINEVLELYVNMILVTAAIFFAKSYLDQTNELFKLRRVGIAMAILCFIGAIIFHIIHNFTLFITTNILQLLTIDIFWLYGVIFWKKNVYARFFAVAYGIPLFIAHDYYFSPYFGFSFFNTSPNFYKLGSLFEMLVFTYAIMHFTKNLALDNKKYSLKILEYAKLIKKKNAVKSIDEVEIDLINKYGFTPTEMNILKDLANKKSNKIISKKHFISENTVKFHIKNIYTKFQVNNRKDVYAKFHNFSN
jgi:DNA-binding CsgD family transcriptional regulator